MVMVAKTGLLIQKNCKQGRMKAVTAAFIQY
jgi:hypothetical protein